MPTPETTAATARHLALAIVAALAVAGAAALAACGSASSPPSVQAQAFGWLRPSPPPRAWRERRLPDGSAQLAYPAGWRAIRSDPGTATAAVRSASGEIRGYLNATPRQGAETLANWGSFRPAHNRDEGDVDVAVVASAANLQFRNGRGSCVIDTYTSSTGHGYREIACIVAGASASTVVVGAAPPEDWPRQGPRDRTRHLQLSHLKRTRPRKGDTMLKQTKARIAAALAVLGIVGAAAVPVAIAGHHHHHHHHGIPQHNGGDHDADNNGGPSDGDGRAAQACDRCGCRATLPLGKRDGRRILRRKRRV